MDNPVGVRCREGARNLLSQRNDLAGAERFLANQISQRLAFDKLHDDKAVIVNLVVSKDGTYIRMIESRDGLCFLDEVAFGPCVANERVRKKFQRNLAVKPAIFGQVNIAHASSTKSFENLILAE